MFIRQNGKLYTELGDGKIVGVEIYPDLIKKVEGTEDVLGDRYEIFSATEIRIKYHIEDNPYIFPVEKVEVVEVIEEPKKKAGRPKKVEEVIADEPIKPTKKSTRKSSGK